MNITDQSKRYIESFLGRLPENKREARHALIQKLAYNPPPETLQCILRLVHDKSLDDRFKEISGKALVLTILAEQQFGVIMNRDCLDAALIAQATETLHEVVVSHKQIASDLTALLDSLSWDDHQNLTRIHEQLALETDRISAALTLAPHLEQLASAAIDNSVTKDRFHLNALALRSMLVDHLDQWQTCLDTGFVEGLASGELTRCYNRLEQDKQAYDYFARVIQETQDAAMLDKRLKGTEDLREIKRSLFQINLRLAPILRDGFDNCIAAHITESDGDATPLWTNDEQQAAISAGEASASAADALRAERDGTLLRALTESAATHKANKLHASEQPASQDRLRIKILAVIIGLLLCGAIGVNVILWSSSAKPIVISPTEFSDTLSLEHVTTMGTVMVSQVNIEQSWRDLSDSQRLEKLSALGAQATGHGFETVILVDHNNDQLAIWTAHAGPNLLTDGH
jgi:hypothetical protein